jgi:hypothetical protein
MTLSPKRRKIVVRGRDFFWVASGEDYGGVGLVVATETTGAPKLFCSFDGRQENVETRLDGRKATILSRRFALTPDIVRQVIEYAETERQWKPFEKGKDLYLGDMSDKIDLRPDKNLLLCEREYWSRLGDWKIGQNKKE